MLYIYTYITYVYWSGDSPRPFFYLGKRLGPHPSPFLNIVPYLRFIQIEVYQNPTVTENIIISN